VYAGACAVVCSVFTIQHPDGKEYTIPVSPTMHCVINLTSQYFLIYLLLFIFISVEDLTSWDLRKARDVVETTKATVQFAPMLCVLFIATRMRALQITENRGAPQGYAQQGMYLASWALVIQFLMCIVLGACTGKPYKTDSLDGSSSAKGQDDAMPYKWLAITVTVIRYLALVLLYAGIIAVIFSVFTINPSNANGTGQLIPPAVPLGPLAGPPPSLDDVPGVKGGMEATGSTIGAGADTVDGATGTVADGTTGAVSKVTGF